MGYIIRTVAAILVGVFASAAFAQDMATIGVTDSRKDTEILIAKILKEKMKIDPALKIRGGDAEDLLLQIQLSANEERGVPVVAYIIDTQIMRRDKDGKATSLVVGIDSFAAIKPVTDSPEMLLNWANKWNSRTLPIRIYVAGERIVVGQNLLTTDLAPLSENQLLSAFSTIVQFWPVLIKDLRENQLIE